MIKLKQILLLEKTLYHGTTVDNAAQIMKQGLTPQIGAFVDRAYGNEYADADIDLPELTFATDKKKLDAAVTAATEHVANKLGKSFHDVTDEEFLQHAAIVKINDGDDYYKHRPSGDENYYGQHPPTVEPGDYYSDEGVLPDEVLTGNGLLKLLRRHGLWPRDYATKISTQGTNEMRNALIKYLIQKYPAVPTKDIAKHVMARDAKNIARQFNLMKWEKRSDQT